MKDPIERADAIAALDDEITITGTANAFVVKDYVQRVLRKLRDLPSAQPQRMRGRWIKSDADGFVCSVCRNGYKMQPTIMGEPMFEFCPCCGADMREGQDG